MAPPAPDLRAEALLYVQWLRGAGGRFYAGEGVAPAQGRGAGVQAPALPKAVDGDVLLRAGAVLLRAGAGNPPVAPTSARLGSLPSRLPVAVPPIRAGAELARAGGPWPDPDPLDRLREEALVCRRCKLCETRTQVVFGEGHRRPRLMIIGEAPGADEDASGRPFVGKAGQLLSRMLAAIGLAREDVYIGNVLKCRPPGNRPPAPEEVAACRPYVEEQIRLLQPELLLLLGNHAAQAVLQTDRGITSIRGELHQTPGGWPALPTFHPAYLLRNPAAKRDAWADLQLAARTLGLALARRPEPESESPE